MSTVPSVATADADTIRPRQHPTTGKRTVTGLCEGCRRTVEESAAGWIHFLSQRPECPAPPQAAGPVLSVQP